MSVTSRLGLSYPAGTDPADVPAWMNALAVELDGMVAPTSHGTLASRPVSSVGTPGIADRMYWATDVLPESRADAAGVGGQLFRDNGTGWAAVGPYASKINMGFFYAPIVTGNLAVTGIGFKPKLVKLSYFRTSLGTGSNIMIGLGAFHSSGRQYSMEARMNSANDKYTVFNEATVVHCDSPNSGLTEWAAAYTSMDADGFTLNWSIVTASANTLRVAWEAWG